MKCYLDMPDGFFQHSLRCWKKNVYFGQKYEVLNILLKTSQFLFIDISV